jgi:plasmid stabilization system protein ParE
MKLIFSWMAIQDLNRIRDHRLQHEPDSVPAAAQELNRRLQSLQQFPELGKPVALAPDPQSLRDLVVGSFTVRYAPRPAAILIVRIWHQKESLHRPDDSNP